jgi:Coenzyme PQQ synthesis protein D (PqqD)
MREIYIARGDRLAARVLGNETIVLCPDDSGLYVLNELGTVLWAAADGRTPLAAIVERVICVDFDVDRATAMQDALEFVEGLREHHILKVSDEPIPTGDDTYGSAPGEAER